MAHVGYIALGYLALGLLNSVFAGDNGLSDPDEAQQETQLSLNSLPINIECTEPWIAGDPMFYITRLSPTPRPLSSNDSLNTEYDSSKKSKSEEDLTGEEGRVSTPAPHNGVVNDMFGSWTLFDMSPLELSPAKKGNSIIDQKQDTGNPGPITKGDIELEGITCGNSAKMNVKIKPYVGPFEGIPEEKEDKEEVSPITKGLTSTLPLQLSSDMANHEVQGEQRQNVWPLTPCPAIVFEENLFEDSFESERKVSREETVEGSSREECDGDDEDITYKLSTQRPSVEDAGSDSGQSEEERCDCTTL